MPQRCRRRPALRARRTWCASRSGGGSDRRMPASPSANGPGLVRLISTMSTSHSGFDRLAVGGIKAGKSCQSTRTAMLRATPGWREINPARSRVSTIWWTEGGVTRKNRCMSASAGRTPVHQRIGMNKRQILALPGREIRSRITARSIHRCPRQWGTSDEHTVPGGTERGGTRATHGDAERRQTCGAQDQAGADLAGRRRRCQRRGDRERRLGRRVHGVPNQTALRGRQSGVGAQ